MEGSRDEYVEWMLALPGETWGELDRRAQRRGITTDELITQAVNEYLAELRDERGDRPDDE